MTGRKGEDSETGGQLFSQPGATILAWRKFRGLSIRDLAMKAGLGEQGHRYISKIEHGDIKHPNIDRLLAIARVLGITSDTPPPSQASQIDNQLAEVVGIWLHQMENRLTRRLREMLREEIMGLHPLQPSSGQGSSEEVGGLLEEQILVGHAKPPLIGIPCYAGERAGTLRPLYGINRVYVEALERIGGTTILIPHTKNITALYPLCTLLQGLLLPGGADIDPMYFDDEIHPALGRTDPDEDRLDLALVEYFLERDLPILGISRGMQLINVARRGKLYQDIASQRPESLRHNFEYTPRQATYLAHPVAIKPDSLLADLLGIEPLMVNSFHHQAVRDLGWDLVASAWAPDGIIEGLESPHHRFVVGIQFQAPELLLQENQRVIRLFQGFIKAASRIKRPPW